MSEGVVAGPALAVPQPEARDSIATCRSARSSVHASQSAGSEADESALTICTVSCDKLEELGYSVEERSAELEIMLMDDEAPYGDDVQVEAAAFLSMGATTPLNELTVVMDVSPVLGRTPRRTSECGQCGASGLSPYPSNSLLLKGDPGPLPEARGEERGKESEGGRYEVAVIPRNAALCSERKMPLADRS
jgi:hypothetical protein